jgi:hypothetical protein
MANVWVTEDIKRGVANFMFIIDGSFKILVFKKSKAFLHLLLT